MEEKGRRECGKRRWARRSTLGRSPKPTDFIPPLQALGPCRALHPRVKPQSTNKYQSIHGLSCLLKHRLVPFLSSFQGRILNQCSIGWVSVKIWGQWDCAIIRCSRFGPSSQSYGFSSSHVWMWELDYKESWAPKNWCFWTVVLEKTLVPGTTRRSNQSTKTLMLGKIEGRRRRGWQSMRWLDGMINSLDNEFEQTPGDRKGQGSWCAAILGVAKSRSGRSTEEQ